jgi:predicted aspartyl protease
MINPLLGTAIFAAAIFGATQWLAPAADDPQPVTFDGNREVIAASTITGQRCHVPGSANGAPVTFEVDTGDPVFADFSARFAARIGLDPARLHYEELWPGTRYGGIAETTLHTLRIGPWQLTDVPVRVYDNWKYTFGDDAYPLLGLAALQSNGVRLEIEGDTCRLTVPRARALTARFQTASKVFGKMDVR